MKIRNLHLNKVKLLIITLFVTVFLLYDFGSSSNVIDQTSEIRNDLFEDIDDDVAVDFNRVRKIDRTRSEKYVDTIENILSGEFSPLDEVVSPSPEYINLGFIMINLNQTTENLTDKFKHSVQKTFYSMLQYWSSAPLNLIVVTDERSVPSVASFLAGILSKEVGLRVITTRSRRWRRVDSVPRVRVHFVNAMDIVQRNKPFVKRLQAVTLQYKENKTFVEDRYLADLFYIAPIYHLAFPALDSIIVIDITDLDFHDSVELLQEELRQVRGGRLIGLGLDMAPSYYLQLGRYRFLHPGSELGYPGPSQGFNTGVVLYNLAAMRRSQLYNSYLTPAMVNMLQEKYMYDFTLAEQDWFTSLSYSHPDLFYVLPCRFNRQTSIQYLNNKMEEHFEEFHRCEPKAEVVVVHTNGCGPTALSCGVDVENATSYTGTYWHSHLQYMGDVHLEMCGLWAALAGLPDDVDTEATCPHYSV